MMNYYTNEELCKKLEVSISKNITIILQKPIFRGGTPQFTPLGGGLTITGFLHDKIQFK